MGVRQDRLPTNIELDSEWPFDGCTYMILNNHKKKYGRVGQIEIAKMRVKIKSISGIEDLSLLSRPAG